MSGELWQVIGWYRLGRDRGADGSRRQTVGIRQRALQGGRANVCKTAIGPGKVLRIGEVKMAKGKPEGSNRRQKNEKRKAKPNRPGQSEPPPVVSTASRNTSEPWNQGRAGTTDLNIGLTAFRARTEMKRRSCGGQGAGIGSQMLWKKSASGRLTPAMPQVRRCARKRAEHYLSGKLTSSVSTHHRILSRNGCVLRNITTCAIAVGDATRIRQRPRLYEIDNI